MKNCERCPKGIDEPKIKSEAIKKIADWCTDSRLVHYLVNIAVGGIWLYVTIGGLRHFRASDGYTLNVVIGVALWLRNGSLAVLFLLRRPASAASTVVKEWLVAIAGTLIGILYSTENARSLMHDYSRGIVSFVMLFALLLSITAIISLGRSFGIVPANRGIITTGLYSFVRHPIYACYIIFDICLLSVMFSWLNLAVVCGFVMTCYLRAYYEERLLRQDHSYNEYIKRTPYMFCPYII